MTEERTVYRLNQYLARCGIASRRGAEDLIAEGVVSINGGKADHPGFKVVAGEDRVTVRGTAVHPPGTQTLILYKPKGVVCTRKDPEGRRTVFDLLPSRMGKRGIQTIGRLDYNSSGSLILTNEGDLHRFLEHPSSEIPRVYEIKAKGKLDDGKIKKLLSGIALEDGIGQADKVEKGRYSSDITRFTLTLHEGRNREVRRLCEAVGLTVLDLKRTRYGPIELAGLPSGKWRDLLQAEAKALKKLMKKKGS